jgi:hypothetical protein
MAYACLVAIMFRGRSAHCGIEKRLIKTAADAGAAVDIFSIQRRSAHRNRPEFGHLPR